MQNSYDESKYMSVNDAAISLSVSKATLQNWIKLNKIASIKLEEGTTVLYTEEVLALKKALLSGENSALRSRRNKKYVSGNNLYKSYISETSKNISTIESLLNTIDDFEVELTTDIISYLVADSALNLMARRLNVNSKNSGMLFNKFLSGKLEFLSDTFAKLLRDLIGDKKNALLFSNEHPELFNNRYFYKSDEDTLGLIYISLCNLQNRKATGSYYTPTKIVKKLVSVVRPTSKDKILDPACGTGNFLLCLPKDIPFSSVFGGDTDEISVKICRINMAIKYKNLSYSEVTKHITTKDFLFDYSSSKYSCILGNPPWGYVFDADTTKKLKSMYNSADGKTVESYDVFIEKALKMLKKNGRLAFVLPEAILNVKAHTAIRRIIINTTSVSYLEYLGNAFDKVACPSIIMCLTNTHKAISTVGMKVRTNNKTIRIKTAREVSEDGFNFTLSDREYKVFNKLYSIPNTKHLENNADFALGIVTGGNDKFITNEKTDSNEMIVKGSDVLKYSLKPTNNYIEFTPDKFQQVAPVAMYRAPERLLYRFICNQLVFAYDDKCTLSLNSANIVIPKLLGLDTKYVLAILNSRVSQFIFKKKFNSVKILRSHIENLPIPEISDELQEEIIDKVNNLILGNYLTTVEEAYDELDEIICRQIFKLTAKETELIRKAVDGENKFLK